MREIGRLEDTNGVIFVDDFATKTEMNVNNLVWKKIRKNKWDDIENVQRGNEKVCGNKFYWDEAYRQFKVQELAKKFNKAVQRTPVGEFANRDRIMISPTAIMVFKKGYSDNNDLFYQTNNSMRAIEPSIPGGEEGKFQKWDGNNNFVEHLYRTDNTPHTFTRAISMMLASPIFLQHPTSSSRRCGHRRPTSIMLASSMYLHSPSLRDCRCGQHRAISITLSSVMFSP